MADPKDLRAAIEAAAHEAHTLGRIYSEGGEKRKPADEYRVVVDRVNALPEVRALLDSPTAEPIAWRAQKPDVDDRYFGPSSDTTLNLWREKGWTLLALFVDAPAAAPPYEGEPVATAEYWDGLPVEAFRVERQAPGGSWGRIRLSERDQSLHEDERAVPLYRKPHHLVPAPPKTEDKP